MSRIVLVAALLVLAACSPEKGVVIDRPYQPPSSWTTSECSSWHTTRSTYRSGGRIRTRTSRTCVAWRPRVHHSPARWFVTLRDGDDQGDRAVSRDTWRACLVGSRYPDCKESSKW